ncbi:MAG: hypothetical protein ICV53_06150 [Flavisolibacter sp.]|nr:hypothetical protein [Flavisolibacter sp.]
MSYTVLGSAWLGHFNQPIAETMYENIKRVELPEWSANDQTAFLIDVHLTLALTHIYWILYLNVTEFQCK